jgi:hypothetical protein
MCSRLEIIDITGRAVKCYPTGGNSRPFAVGIEAARLVPGVYLARFESAAGPAERKFVIAQP